MQEDRNLLIKKTKKEDELSDLKQHADGMLRDFEKFNENSSNRAIWELVQNACDLTTECKIEIDYRNNQFSFSHNGQAFTTNTLMSLVKQVSGKYGDEDIPEVGKYGTGFLTTHTFGRRFKLNSFLSAGNELYLPIKDFEIDRTPKTWKELSDNISNQKERVYELVEKESAVEVSELKTTFTYLPETEKEREYIKDSFKYLDDYIPLVFTINDRLKEVVIYHADESTKDTYQLCSKEVVKNDKEINLYKSILHKNNEERHLYSIKDEDKQIEIILPIDKNNEVIDFNENIARLFYYYPLIGSENFGVNFIINCKKFLPTEPRDAIHLNSDKDQVKDDEETNRLLINKCTNLIFSFLESNLIDVKNPLLYTNVNFITNSDDDFLDEYFNDLNKEWNNKLSKLPFVKTNDGFKSIESVSYLSEDFLDEKYIDCFYELISNFYSDIPIKEDIIRWSQYAINWKNEDIIFIKHSDLLEKISECTLQDFDKTTLIQYYEYIIKCVSLVHYFNDLALIPNIEGYFNKIGELLKPKNLNDKLIDIGKVLIPDSISKLIHRDFKFNFSLNSFNRRDFSDDVKNTLDEKNISDSIFYPESLNNEDYHFDLVELKAKVEESYFKSLLDFCKLTNSIESTSKPKLLLKKISKYYNWDEKLIHLPNLGEDSENIEYRSIRKVLIKVFCNLIALHNNNWVEDNLDFMIDLCSLYDDSYKEVFKESKIYPNQLFELNLAEDLKRDKDVSPNIKEFYLEVEKEDINKTLSIGEFNDFLPDDSYIENKYLTTKIEETLFQDDDISDIENHQHQETILNIIFYLTDTEYQTLFPRLNHKKANIMISVVSKEETKEDIFSIVRLDDEKIKKIGDLARRSNINEILNKALEITEDKNQLTANFEFKRQIGTHIEEKLKEYLKQLFQPKEIKCEVLSEQDGQDIVIKIKDEVKYYIEVKSRWDKRTSIKMSKNQTLRSNEHQHIYALCCVDMTDYHQEDRYEISDINKILENIKFINNIGEKVEHLIKVFEQTKELDEIHLDGDYRTLVPQKVIEEFSLNFSEFEDYLINLLKN